MIFSKVQNRFVPVNITRTTFTIPNYETYHMYQVKDNKIIVGEVDLKDTPYGVHVEMIKNFQPGLYSHFGQVADQIEVEHCMQKMGDNFKIESTAAMNSHALHFLRGKRFRMIKDETKNQELFQRFHTTDPNEIVQQVINSTPKGEKFDTKFLGQVPMYMPKTLIQKYIEIIKKCPLLKNCHLG